MKLYYLLFLLLLVFASCAPVGPNIAIVPDDTFMNIGNNVTVKNENGQSLKVTTQVNESITVKTNFNNTPLMTGDFYMDCSAGFIRNCWVTNIPAHNPDVDVSTSPEDVSEAGGVLILPQLGRSEGAVALDVSSDSINDTFGGNGSWTLFLEGLDDAYHTINESLMMNGTTVVETVNEFWRLNRATVIRSGSFNTNVGTITIARTSTIPFGTWSIVAPGVGVSRNSHFTTPRGVTSWFISATVFGAKGAGGQKPIVTYAFKTNDINGSTIERKSFQLDTNIDSYVTINDPVREVLGEGVDIVWQVTVDQNDAEIYTYTNILSYGNKTIGLFKPPIPVNS